MTNLQTATLGGGCYWCLDAYFRRIKGITTVTSGYSGGHLENPTTDQVYRMDTGHAEVVQLEFDPDLISYEKILEIFYVMHDPTTLNRQGNDVGEIYRSVIFYHDGTQQEIAQKVTQEFAKPLWPDPIVTQIVPFEKFWPASEDMQEYYDKNPMAGYCQVIIEPKIAKLRQKFSKLLASPSENPNK